MKRIAWEPAAQADVRRIEQKQAIELLHALADFVRTGHGDVRKLMDDRLGRYRLRLGDWRIPWSVENRKDAYR